MNLLQIISDKNKKSLKIKKNLIKQINKNNFINKNIIIVIGGDGLCFRHLKKIKV